MNKKLGSILVLIVGAGLMVYSMARTFHLLSSTLPPGQEILAVIALLGFDLGLVAWLITFLKGAEGGMQRAIAALMVVINLIAVIIGFMGDTLLTAGNNGLIAALDAASRQTIVIATASMIAANIAAVVFFHMASPENLRHMAEESAKDKITAQSLKAIEQQASLLANDLAPLIAADWVANMTADFTAALTSGRRAPAILDQPSSVTVKRSEAKRETEKPSKLDSIKQRLSEVNSVLQPTPPDDSAQMWTMAADAPASVTLPDPKADRG
jgi:hypothetical protein